MAQHIVCQDEYFRSQSEKIKLKASRNIAGPVIEFRLAKTAEDEAGFVADRIVELIEEGVKPADIAVFRVDEIDFTGVHDAIGGLVLAGSCHRADTVIINGKPIIRDRQFVRINLDNIKRKTNQMARKLVHSAETRTGRTYI